MDENNMTLGQRLTMYRTKARLSQDSLAELLEVSRQSVSKWETDASVPELSKLVRLSQVFGVTLDELVTGEVPPQTDPISEPAAPPQDTQPSPPQTAVPMEETLRRHRQKIAGVVLLAVGGVVCLLVRDLFLLLWPALVLGLLCLVCRRVTGLEALWLLWLTFVTMCYAFTSADPFTVFRPAAYGHLTIQLIIAWALWVVLGILIAVTVSRCRAGQDALPSWPMLAVMAAACAPVILWYLCRFGPMVLRARIFLLLAVVLGSLALAKLRSCRK